MNGAWAYRLVKSVARFFGLALLFVGASACAQGSLQKPKLPEGPAAFRFERIDGVVDTVGRHRGKVVLLSIFATWADVALLEVPLYQSLHQEFSPEDFILIQIALDDHEASVRAFVQTFDVSYLVGRPLDRGHFTGDSGPFGPIGMLPTSILLDRDGRIALRSDGTWSPPALKKAIKGLLAADRSNH